MTPKPTKQTTQPKPAVGADPGQINANTGKVNEAKTEQPKPEAAPSKQQIILNNLTAAWKARGVELGKLEAKPDGKFLLVVVGPGWPVVKIGPTGGIDLPQIKSYAKAFDAAVNGDELLKKQQERAAKKQAANAPAPQPRAQKSEAKTDTPTTKKQKAHEQLEKALA